MEQKPKYSKRYPELLVYPDGRAYDTHQKKWLTFRNVHQCSYRGPVLYWSIYKKTYYIHVARLVYEVFILDDLLTKGYSVDYINGNHSDIRPDNIKKVPRSEVGTKKDEKDEAFSMWLGSDSIYM
jgi:hypothetical protein